MVLNSCKHDGEFHLIYCAGVDHYVYRCERCMVYKINFNPVEAGKIRLLPYGKVHPLFLYFFNGMFYEYCDDGFWDQWREIIAYVRREEGPAIRIDYFERS